MVKRRLTGGVILAGMASLCMATTPLPATPPGIPPTTALIGTLPQPSWQQLSLEQKTILAPLSEQWNNMENLRKKKWLSIAQRYPTLKPEERTRLQERMKEWASLSPEQRAKARGTYKEFQMLPGEQKESLKQKWEIYKNLPPEEQQKVRESGKSSQLLNRPSTTTSEETISKPDSTQ